MASDKLSFTSYNVKGINSLPNGFVVRKRHTPPLRKKQWSDNFKGKIIYSHGTTISCGVAVGFLGSKSLEVVETKSDDQGRILILDMKICDRELLLVNPYNANSEKEQWIL